MPFFFSTWLFQPLLASSSHPSSPTRIAGVGPDQLPVAYLRKLFGKDGLWTQPTLFGRGELPRMVQPMQRLWCQNAERCVAYFKRRWTNVTNVKKLNSRPAQK